MNLKEAVESQILIGDGANGTFLAAQGFIHQPYDWAIEQAPDLVRASHRAYFEAGSDFIETNTFQANGLRMEIEPEVVERLNKRGAELANEAREGFSDRFILGAIGPCGKPMEPYGHILRSEARLAFFHQAKGLISGGVDGFILETFVDLAEMEVAVEAIREVSDLPIIVSKAFVEDGEALAGGLPIRCAETMALLSSKGVIAIGANCVVGPQRMTDLVRMLAETTSLPVLAFPTPGLPQLVKGAITYDATPEYFAKAVSRLIEAGASILGGCCGTTPDHIRALREAVKIHQARPKARVAVRKEATEARPPQVTEPTELSRKIAAGQFIKAVEMDVPRGLKIEKLISGAKQLKEIGVDVVNISDGARARLRMNPSAVASLIQNRTGLEAVMHFACRDRNLLAIQADLLGCHALGVRNILAVTGDPANVGDYPSATSVFDVDSVGLVRILARFNEGIDLAGYSIGVKGAYTIAVAYNPLAIDQTLEDERLRKKVDAGANVVYTQPVFRFEEADQAVSVASKLGIPCFVGVLPLKNSRHAEFMHNEVPGIEVPMKLRQRMIAAATDEEALEIGIEEASSLSAEIRKIAGGLYLMPPFGSAAIAHRVLSAVDN